VESTLKTFISAPGKACLRARIPRYPEPNIPGPRVSHPGGNGHLDSKLQILHCATRHFPFGCGRVSSASVEQAATPTCGLNPGAVGGENVALSGIGLYEARNFGVFTEPMPTLLLSPNLCRNLIIFRAILKVMRASPGECSPFCL